MTGVVPNLAEVGVGSGGAVSLFTSAPSDAVIDLEGYVTTTSTGGAGLYNALPTPARICDTRGSNPSNLTGGDTQCNADTAKGSPDNLVGPGNPLTITVNGNGGVPALGVSAAVLNVSVVRPTAPGYVTAYPAGQPRPTASNVNYRGGQVVGNRVVVPVSGTGQVNLYATASPISSSTSPVTSPAPAEPGQNSPLRSPRSGSVTLGAPTHRALVRLTPSATPTPPPAARTIRSLPTAPVRSRPPGSATYRPGQLPLC